MRCLYFYLNLKFEDSYLKSIDNENLEDECICLRKSSRHLLLLRDIFLFGCNAHFEFILCCTGVVRVVLLRLKIRN